MINARLIERVSRYLDGPVENIYKDLSDFQELFGQGGLDRLERYILEAEQKGLSEKQISHTLNCEFADMYEPDYRPLTFNKP